MKLMPPKSFYDLDYIIALNEQRIEQYQAAYQKALDRITNIILIYSAMSIFLVPMAQEMLLGTNINWFVRSSFGAFALLFMASVYYTVQLIIPEKLAYIGTPARYYTEYRKLYETTSKQRNLIEYLLKAAYIKELEKTLDNNVTMHRRKGNFYQNAVIYALLSSIPYLVCLGFYITTSPKKVEETQIINRKLHPTFGKIYLP